MSRPDESASQGGGQTYVPTLGLPAHAIDIYRTVGIHTVENKPPSWCFTDLESASALGRIIDGPIKSGADISGAESALRALLLHEYVEVLVPSIKTMNRTGLASYVRLDHELRNDAAFSAFKVANSFDRLFATEWVDIHNGRFTGSSNPRSALIDTNVEQFRDQYPSAIMAMGELAHAFPSQIGAATSFSNPCLTEYMDGGAAGFIDELYRRIDLPWRDVAQSTPALQFNLKLPPLVAIVLARAPWRDHIPGVLKELREELAPVRSELNLLNLMIDSCKSQADIIAQTQRVNESFNAIVPESLLTPATLRWRKFISVFNFLRSVRQLYSIAADPLSANPEKLAELMQSAKTNVAKDSRIVSRSIPAAKMAELLKIENVRESITTHFSEQEVQLIAKFSDRGHCA